MSSNKIVLISSDGKSFEIDKAVACKSLTLALMIEDGCTAKEAISIEKVNGKTLEKVIEYCKKLVEVGSIQEDQEAKKILKIWEDEFIKLDDSRMIFDLVMAASLPKVKDLKDLICQKIADSIKGKTPEEFREILNVKNK